MRLLHQVLGLGILIVTLSTFIFEIYIKRSEIVSASAGASSFLSKSSHSHESGMKSNTLEDFLKQPPIKIQSKITAQSSETESKKSTTPVEYSGAIFMEWTRESYRFNYLSYKAFESLLASYPNAKYDMAIIGPGAASYYKLGNLMRYHHYCSLRSRLNTHAVNTFSRSTRSADIQ
jgi:hypothetical protein